MISGIEAIQRQKKRPEKDNPVMYQHWEELLFLHWAVDREMLQSKLPKGLHLDTYNGVAYVGVVPFFMQHIRPRFLPAVPWVSYFLELNVRTYVTDETGLPGVWFFSLDCNQPIAVRVARRFFYLPYMDAKMKATRQDHVVEYVAQRKGKSGAAHFAYAPDGPAEEAEAGSLTSFLVDRYWLFAHDAQTDRLFKGRVWHEPYQVGAAKCTTWSSAPLDWNGMGVAERPPDVVARAENVAVRVYPVERV